MTTTNNQNKATVVHGSANKASNKQTYDEDGGKRPGADFRFVEQACGAIVASQCEEKHVILSLSSATTTMN